MDERSEILNIYGKRITGDAVRSQNVTAAAAIANIVKSSLGPVGLDKMLVDAVGDVTVTNDGATILKMMEVEHPAAKVLIELAQLQDEEVGDGTTSVVIIAAELLKVADELVKQKIHPTTIMSGYRLACKEALKYMQEHLAISVDELGRDCVLTAAKTSMSSKLIGPESDFFANMVLEAAESMKYPTDQGGFKYAVDGINILKAHGGSSMDSVLIHGYALNCTVASAGMPKRIVNPKICCLDFSLQKVKMNLGINIEVENPEKVEAIRKEEIDIMTRRMNKILKTGVNVILTTGGIDNTYIRQAEEAGVAVVRRCLKKDLKRIAKATGATLCSSLVNVDGEESFDVNMIGHADEFVQKRICDDELILINGTKNRPASAIILRGANDFMVDEMERSIHDALYVVKRVLECKQVVVGGGAVETALSIYLENFATSLASREQLAIAEFASALMSIPKILAVNAAQDSTDLVAKLRAYHSKAQSGPEFYQLQWYGLDLEVGDVRDNRKAGVLEPLLSKVKTLKFATEAAITILRIDDMIKIKSEDHRKQNYCEEE